ncbi:MAG: ATP-binding protein [Gemmatimonadota bacterium]
MTPPAASLPPVAIGGAIPDPGEIRRAQLATFGRQTPINVTATIGISALTAVFLWPVAPRTPLLIWTALQVGLALLALSRHYRRRATPVPRSVSPRGLRRATVWTGVAGLLWGASAVFLKDIPPVNQMALVVVLCGMAAGATTTLAAVPMAASLYIVGTLVPPIVWFLAEGRGPHLSVGLEGIVFALAMLAATRVVYATFIDDLKTKQLNAALLTQFHSERQEWLEISESAAAFALLDSGNRLILWNENLCSFLSIPTGKIERGIPADEFLAEAATPVAVASGRLQKADWIAMQLAPTGTDGIGQVHQFTNGRWLRSTVRRTKSDRVVLLFVDVSELKQAEAALQQREAELRQVQRIEAVGKLAGGVAHDFNNILTIISGYSDLLIAALAEQPSLLEFAEESKKAASRATSLTRQLLAFSRRQTLQPRLVDLSLLVAQLAEVLRRLVPDHVQLRLELGESLGTVLVDPNQIEQVLVNLVSNACQAMPSSGRLTIQTSTTRFDPRSLVPSAPGGEDDYILVTVSDTGEGIDPAVLERVFEPFFSTKALGTGTGLGLAMVYGTVKQSGGFIGVESSIGIGTAFKIYLPRAETFDPPFETAAVDPPARVRGSETVLVVEDEYPVRRLVTRILTNAGYHVLETASPLAGLDICRTYSGPIHLVVTDVVMPEMGGRQFVEQAKTIRTEPRVLFMSGYTADALGRRGLLDPGVELIEKPFTAVALLNRVRGTLDAD